MSAPARQTQAFGKSAPYCERQAAEAEEARLDQEAARLAALDRIDMLDTPREETFDRIARLARKLFDAPIALVSFIDAHRQWYKSSDGFGQSEAARDQTFCRYVVEDGNSLIVPDATKDARFHANPSVVGAAHIRAYMGVPLKTPEGYSVGTLCVIDTKPRNFDREQLGLLDDLAQLTMDELELRMLAAKDTLTGAMSRRAFKDEGRRATALALRKHDDLSCIVLDLDEFNAINEQHGHVAGDAVLTAVSNICRAKIRSTDAFGRLGGKKFAVLLPASAIGDAIDIAEELRAAIGDQPVKFGEGNVTVTASAGVSALDQATRDFDTLLQNADTALRQAKEAGRNRVFPVQPGPVERKSAHRRVLKGGQIVFNAGAARIDCTVRSLSDEGAGIDVSSTAGLPRRFDLVIKADRLEKRCRVVAMTERHIDVEFEPSAE